MNRMYYIRHGENLANITKEFSHRKVDYPLTEKGTLQARQTAEYFIDKKIDFIYSSPLKRALETTQIISDRIKKNYSVVEELREINVGSLEDSKPTREAWDLYTGITNDWDKGLHERTFPCGENYHGLLHRFKAALTNMFRDKNNCSVIVVAHGGIIASAIKEICSNQDITELISKESHNCSITEFEIEIKNNNIICQLLKWANHEHLSGDAGKLISGLPE